MQNKLLVTFGCSWTQGVGVGYTAGQSQKQFQSQWYNDCDLYSFRALLAKKLGYQHINFSEAGSSNQRQFRLARDFFIDVNNIKKYDQILVLWGITSTARSEMFDSQKNQYENFFYHAREPWVLARLLLKHSYDHKNELDTLSKNMQFWDQYFKSLQINNFWFDTFNTHDYQYQNKFNMINLENKPRDLLSQLCKINGIDSTDQNYHLSNWIIDTDRLQPLIDLGVLNPYSLHPTKLGHEQLTDFFLGMIT